MKTPTVIPVNLPALSAMIFPVICACPKNILTKTAPNDNNETALSNPAGFSEFSSEYSANSFSK